MEHLQSKVALVESIGIILQSEIPSHAFDFQFTSTCFKRKKRPVRENMLQTNVLMICLDVSFSLYCCLVTIFYICQEK